MENQLRTYQLENISCPKCAFKLEKEAQNFSGIQSFDLNIATGQLKLKAENEKICHDLTEHFERLGHPSREIQLTDKDNQERKEHKRELKKLAVAGFSAGNIMLFSSAVYTGAEGSFAQLFNWGSFLFLLPSLLYSGQTFFNGFWASLKRREASIDTPIVVALGLGTLLSLYNLLAGSEGIYFDSIANLIFLLLIGRFFLKKFQAKALLESKVQIIPDHYSYKVKTEAGWIQKKASELGPEDEIQVLQDQIIPGDGRMGTASVYVNQSLLTGESTPYLVGPGSPIYAGTQLLSPQLTYKVSSLKDQTRIGQILNDSIQLKLDRSNFVSFIDRLGQNFTIGVLLLSLAGFSYFMLIGDQLAAFDRTLALLVVACPCALAFGFPLVLSLGLQRARNLELLVRSADIFEKISEVKNIFFDKTGTLTQGQLKVIEQSNPLEEAQKQILLHLESHSQHPVAQALIRHLKTDSQDIRFFSRQEFPVHEELGKGVFGEYAGIQYSVRRADSNAIEDNNNVVDFYANEDLICRFSLEDELRDQSKKSVEYLKKIKLESYILSGDHEKSVAFTGENLGIDKYYSELSPEEKLQIIKRHSGKEMMIGDGINDSVALAASHVSVAMAGPIEKLLQTADIVLLNNQIKHIPQVFALSHHIIKTLTWLSLFSISYNVVCAVLALMGYITPLVAALLMPMSSILVIMFSFYRMKEGQWKLSM